MEVTYKKSNFAHSIATNMFEDSLKKYDSLRKEYQEKIILPMGLHSYGEYSEVLFSAHTCAIEGNSFSVDDTRSLKENGLGMIPVGKSLLECMEMSDHFRAYEYVMGNLEHPLDEALLKETNRLLMEHTQSYRVKDAVAGEYTTTDMAAGDTVFGSHEKLVSRVPALLASTEKTLADGAHPMIVAAKFHGFFEYLHPFRDGNGRTGRLISNFILRRAGHPLFVIKLEERAEYISALRHIRTEGTDEYLQAFFVEKAINHMQEELDQKSRNSHRVFFF